MSALASPAAFTISDPLLDGPAAFPFFISLIDYLTMFFFIKSGMSITVFAW